MKLFSSDAWMVRTGVIARARVITASAPLLYAPLLCAPLACTSQNNDDNSLDAGKEVKPTELDPGEEQCSNGDKGKVCVTSGGKSDAGAAAADAAADQTTNPGTGLVIEAGANSPSDAGITPGSDADSNQTTDDDGDGSDGDNTGLPSDQTTTPPTNSDDDGSQQVDAGVVPTECSVIRGKVRDFRRGDHEGGHPDFETRMGSGEKNLLKPRLSDKGRPQLATEKPASIKSKASFSQWYDDVKGVNASFDISLQLEQEDGFKVFGTTTFFPLDDLGFGHEGLGHNFGFTTELHAHFLFEGGGSFQLAGDDDLWLFVDGQLLIDLGGVHGWQTSTLELATVADSLGLQVGQVYSLDVFHAERHSTESKLLAKTNLSLVDCD